MNTIVNSKFYSINKFILYNVEETQPWVTFYEENKRKWDNDIKKFSQLNSKSMPYLDYLKYNMPMICPNNWVVDQVKEKYGASSH